jgi:hypothetical protein
MIGLGKPPLSRHEKPAEPELNPQERQANQLLATATAGGGGSERLTGWSSIDQVFEELRRVLEGWQPEQAKAPAASPAPAPASPPLPADRGEIVKLVRAQMGHVLRTRPFMLERQAAKQAAKVVCDERDFAYKVLGLPSTTDEKAVVAFLAEQKSRQLLYRQALAARNAAEAAALDAESEHKRAACRLRVMVAEAVLVLPEIAENEAIKAAQHMVQQALPAMADKDVARILAAPPPQSVAEAAGADDTVAAAPATGQQAPVAEIERTMLVVAKAAAAALHLAPQVTDAITAFNQTREPASIGRPVRPTEEEVQRYLTQMETFMRRRQTARQELTRILTARQQLKQAIEQAQENLRQAMARVTGTVAIELAVVQECAAAVLGKADIAGNGMSDYFVKPKGIDDVSYPNPSRRDARGIKTMRKLTREVAVCFGKLNEAQTSLSAAKRTSVTSARTSGIATCQNFQECAGWTEETRLAHAKAERERLALQTKIELLNGEVEAHTTEVAESVRDLYRLVVCTKPSQSAAMPCDELRALLNAAAWMVRKEGSKSDGHDREGDYPLY